MTAIIVPVFNAAAETTVCLTTLEQTIDQDRPVIVIDDASTDPASERLMSNLPSSWVTVRNETNLGFVGTANLGISLAGRADVVLLNSDTQPAPGWLEAIETCARSDDSIASVTPWTNNGEIASLPEFCQPNPAPTNPDQWARACRESGTPQYPDIPTAVGFCMWLRRTCLDAIGAFDEQAFGRGYGEENDWSMRALEAGWRNVLCDDAFVTHHGNASFGPLGLAPGGEAMEKLLARHPDYLERVQAFIQTDPLAARRRAVVERYQQQNDDQ